MVVCHAQNNVIDSRPVVRADHFPKGLDPNSGVDSLSTFSSIPLMTEIMISLFL